MAFSVDQFGKSLVSAGLFTADEVKAFWVGIPAAERPKEGDGFAQFLIKQAKLTPFQAQELLAGRGAQLIMGDYLILQEIGAGGMGKVYKARHRRMERVVALKVMSAAAMKDEAAVKRFQREVRAAARLEHSNIVTAYDSGEAGNVKYLVMQFVDGGDLSDLVKKNGALEVERAVDYVMQAARGLAFAHGEGVIHRDIKPANLLLDKKGVVKILDMGLARIESSDDGLTATEQVMGTVDYMSPEQAANTKTADGRSDIYSLGCTLWYLLTAKKLYDGDTLISRLMSHRMDPLPSLVKTRDNVPWALEQTLHKLIAKSPQERFQTMDEVLAALEPFAPSGSSRAGMGSSIVMGSGPQNAELSAFLKTVGPTVKTDAKAAPSRSNVNVAATEQLSKAEIATDPKSTIVPLPKKAPGGKPQPKGSAGKKGPPVKLIAAGVGGFALLAALGIWLIVRDKDGNEVAKIAVPDGGSVTVQPAAATVAKPTVTPTPSPTASFFPSPLVAPTPVTSQAPSPPPGDYALELRGFGDQSSWVDVPSLLLSETGPLTLEAQVWSVGHNEGYVLGTEDVRIRLFGAQWAAEATPAKTKTVRIESRRGYHLAAVRTDGELRMYVDGKRIDAQPLRPRTGPQPAPKSKPLKIGGNNAHLRLDEIRISRTARYDQDFTSPTKHTPDSDTLALYHCDDGAGDVLKDASGNGHDGKITKPAWVLPDGSPIPPTAPPSSAVVYLDDLPEVESKNLANRPLGKRGKYLYLSETTETTILFRGKPVEHTLWMHPSRPPLARLATDPTAFARYQLDGRYATFAAEAGIHESTEKDPQSPVTFRLLGDGRELWKSQPMQKRGESAEVAVDIRGVKELRLETASGEKTGGCHATWFMPRLTPIAAAAPSPAVAPFDAAQAKAHQAAWAKHLGTDVVKPNSIGMQMTLIPPGEFLMGSTDADIALALKIAEETKLHVTGVQRIQDECPQHRVRITQPFRLAAHEVTIGQFAKFVEQAKYKTQAEEFGGNSAATKPEEVKPENLKLTWRTPGQAVTDDSPVTQVSWNDAVAFCNWLSGQEQLTPCYQRDGDSWTLLPKANGYRLPTEAEWEYCCRAGTTTQFWFGDNWQDHDKFGWSKNNAGGRPHSVGSLPTNPFGLYDMHGNVWEWCHDWYDGKWYEKSPSDDPVGPSRASIRVDRGGGWYGMPASGRSSFRIDSSPSDRNFTRGFRPALSSVGAPSSTASVATSTPPVVTPPPVAKPVGPAPALAVAPFDAKTARSHQDAWAKHLGIKIEMPNSVGQTMILIPPGEFLMGSTDDQVEAALKVADKFGTDQLTKDRIQKNERPQHKVVITKPYLLSATEVTIGQFQKFAAATGYQTEAEKAEAAAKAAPPPVEAGQPPPKPIQTYINPGYVTSDDLPAAFITWNDATAYCEWLSTQEKTTYRLPTEAEWEYACRAGTTTQYSFGDDYNELPKYGWYINNSGGKSHPVGTLLANPFGLFDMHGNLYEWCQDYFDEKWYEKSSSNDPNGPAAGSSRVIRGGSWYNIASFCRSAYRFNYSPSHRSHHIGFRCVRVADASASTASVTPQPNVPAASPSKLFMHDPAFPQWMKDVQAMPAEKQLEAVSKKLVELNPGFDGKLLGGDGLFKIEDAPRIENGVVTHVRLHTDAVTDISPIRALTGLESFRYYGTKSFPESKFNDLSPLNGMTSLKIVNIGETEVSDLTPLRGMSLESLVLTGNPSNDDLTPLQSMTSLKLLWVIYQRTSTLEPLKGLTLTELNIRNTKVSDLSPLADMTSLAQLNMMDTPIADLSPLAGCKNLTKLWANKTQVTAAQVAALQKALPNCKIEWDDPAKATPQPATGTK